MTKHLLTILASIAWAMTSVALGNVPQAPDPHGAAKRAFDAGNFKDAYAAYSALALSPSDEPSGVGDDLVQALSCLNQLGRADESDDFREKVIALHGKNWRLLWAAAKTLIDDPGYGKIIAGKFRRGQQRASDGRFVSSRERDRVRALQLMYGAMARSGGEADHNALGEFHLSMARMFLSDHGAESAWRLQTLTDLSTLPDYDDFYGGFGGPTPGAPVDEKGNPVFYSVPESFEKAANDGERWHWCLQKAATISPAFASRARLIFAEFLNGQFGVETMAFAGYGRMLDSDSDDSRKDESGPYAVSTLGEDETIARLANGIKRFKLPAEFNFIHLLQDLGEHARREEAEPALDLLGSIFENRQQYERAAEYWRNGIARFGPGENNLRRDRLDQIVGNWGQFEGVRALLAGGDASFPFVFRNGKSVHFEAWELHVEPLLDDVKAYIRSKPRDVDGERIQIDNIGLRIVEKHQSRYLGRKIAAWDVDLSPREKHFDRRIIVHAPLKKAGAYLITSMVGNGNTSNLVLWIADTVLVKKPIDGGSWCFVADAATGAPVADAKVDFFAWQNSWHADGSHDFAIHEFARQTDAAGQVTYHGDKDNGAEQWLIIATTPKGRLAYLGFTNAWAGGRNYDLQSTDRKVLLITDRPVYRPGQTVKFKFWIGLPTYDERQVSPFAGRPFTVEVTDPRGQKNALPGAFTADKWGGFDGELALPADATPGQFNLQLADGGGGSFRVEEYKKPEFEVKIDAPAEPIVLGDTISATISARYYFGAPVTSAKVKYKVLRTSETARWFPPGPWDWLFGPGYWWFSSDYVWYPGWADWGCLRPLPPWWGASREQPEVIAEGQAPIGRDGTFKLQIDTSPAKLVHGDTDHRYQITAEVTDESRRTIVGTGSVIAARKPFKVYAWLDRGYYAVGDTIDASFAALTSDQKPVQGKGTLRLLQISYKDNRPVETELSKWDLDTDDRGSAHQQIHASQPGQYRLSYSVTDSKGHQIEGGYVFVIRGEKFDGREFRFNDLELIADKKEYHPGDTVRLMINAQHDNATVVLSVRACNSVLANPKLLYLKGKSAIEEIGVVKDDMPNFFVEALTVSDGRVFDEVREVVVPPENRVINVAVVPSAPKYRPGEKAKVQVKLTDMAGNPVAGSAVLSIYDKSIEYISNGSNVPELKSFFWNWRRSHSPQTEDNTQGGGGAFVPSGETKMQPQWVAIYNVTDLDFDGDGIARRAEYSRLRTRLITAQEAAVPLELPTAANPGASGAALSNAPAFSLDSSEAQAKPLVEPAIRTNFADTAFWSARIETDSSGTAQVELPMPENLTTWKARVWSMGSGCRVGQGDAEVVTYKNLIVRLQSPRFFVQKDQFVLSADVHNYLGERKHVRVQLELDGPALAAIAPDRLAQEVDIEPEADKRVDWRVRAVQPGTAIVRMKALTDEESDATQMSFPVYVHGMLKTESLAGAINAKESSATLAFNVPQERLPEQSRLEIRYSPSVALAMVDALPYLVDYPYGCTEQTLNRFLPTVITQNVLTSMKLNLPDIRAKRTNLNAQEIGDDAKRAADWKRNNPPNPDQRDRNPVFDEATVRDMSRAGAERLANMQCADGGWGWFSGDGESSWPHTTALVVHGLQIARQNEVALPAGMLERGVEWLKRYQARQIELLDHAPKKVEPWKDHADELDALVYMVLMDAGMQEARMDDFLYRDRTHLAVYAKALYGLALQKQQSNERLGMILQNISQYVVKDDENGTAYLRMPPENPWWNWYGSDVEAMGYYLKLLARAEPKGELAPRLAKYLINNRKHASYWNSTRDTAICVEALADYIKASAEDRPDQTITISLDGRKMKEVHVDASNLFSYDNRLVLLGADVPAGRHEIEFGKAGSGPLYFNAYVTNFTLEDPITRAGLEVKVDRKFYKLEPANKTIQSEGSHGQAVDQKVEKYQRKPLADGAELKSGDLVDVELEIDSKNDYEYVLFEDFKPAGFEPVEVRSGYNGNDLNAYMELHDNRVCFFARELARGKHSVSYRLRAETPGKFSALPARAGAMYAPELKANSDEMKLGVSD